MKHSNYMKIHISRVLGYHRVPPVVGRYINVTHDVKRFADEELKRTIFRSPGELQELICLHYFKSHDVLCLYSRYLDLLIGPLISIFVLEKEDKFYPRYRNICVGSNNILNRLNNIQLLLQGVLTLDDK